MDSFKYKSFSIFCKVISNSCFCLYFKNIIYNLNNTNRFIKDRREELVRTEFHFLFLCKLIGPFLSKIHLENTNLLIDVIFIFFFTINKLI